MTLSEIYNSRDYLSGDTWADYCARKGITASDYAQARLDVSSLRFVLP